MISHTIAGVCCNDEAERERMGENVVLGKLGFMGATSRRRGPVLKA